jgi:hypothetical protein
MVDDRDDPLDPLNPLYPYLWGDWVCPDCAEDGHLADLMDGTRCPNCGAAVEVIPR